jgi:hypothetical protein
MFPNGGAPALDFVDKRLELGASVLLDHHLHELANEFKARHDLPATVLDWRLFGGISLTAKGLRAGTPPERDG